MTKKIQLKFIGPIILSLLFLFLILLPKTNSFQSASKELSIGIILDLLITIPLIYFLFIRKTKTPNFTVLYMILLGIGVASLIIPLEHDTFLSNIKMFIIPIIELSLVGLIIKRVLSLKKSYKQNHRIENDFHTNILKACDSVLPGRLGKILATEISVFYYLMPFKNTKIQKSNEFSYFNKNGIQTIIKVFLVLLIFETAVVHILIDKWNSNIAWILTFIGLYTGLQILSILRSMNKRLILIDDQSKILELKYGFACQTSINFDKIASIEKSSKTVDNKNNARLSIFDILETPNVIIYLKEQETLHKLYGFEKSFESISLYVDDKETFVHEIEEVIKNNYVN